MRKKISVKLVEKGLNISETARVLGLTKGAIHVQLKGQYKALRKNFINKVVKQVLK